MQQESLLAFFLFALVAAVTPGPSNVMVFAAGAQGGLRRGLRCLAGVVAGMALLMGLAVLGLGSVMRVVPGLLGVMKGVGALFLLWLAWKIAASPPMQATQAKEAVGFWRALAFQWVNPKSWVVSASAASTFAGGMASPLAQAGALAAVFALAAAPSGFVWLAFGAGLQRWLTAPRRARAFNLAMGALLAASVAMILV